MNIDNSFATPPNPEQDKSLVVSAFVVILVIFIMGISLDSCIKKNMEPEKNNVKSQVAMPMTPDPNIGVLNTVGYFTIKEPMKVQKEKGFIKELTPAEGSVIPVKAVLALSSEPFEYEVYLSSKDNRAEKDDRAVKEYLHINWYNEKGDQIFPSELLATVKADKQLKPNIYGGYGLVNVMLHHGEKLIIKGVSGNPKTVLFGVEVYK